MAGNIIPAIATANAIVAGLVVLLAFRVLQSEFSKCQSVYLRLKPNHRNQLFVPDKTLNAPNPKCYVCSPQPQVVVALDVDKMTVKEFQENVLKNRLNMVAPDAICEAIVLISSEEGETEENNDKKLSELNIQDGSILKVDDYMQDYALVVIIAHKEGPEFEVISDCSLKPKLKEDKQEDLVKPPNGTGPVLKDLPEDDDDDLCIVEEDEVSSATPNRKRKTSTEAGPSKKPRIESNLEDDNDIEIIDDEVTPME